MANNASQNTLDVYYPQILGPHGLDPARLELALQRIYDFLYRIAPIDPNAENSVIVTDGFIDQLLLKLHLSQIFLTHETFFASTAICSWNSHQLNYKDQEYTIPAGSTTLKYIYWSLSSPGAYLTSATTPVLGENDYIIAIYASGAGTVKEVWQPRNATTGVGAHTITLAKITGGGANGSLSWNADGVITAFTDPT